MSENISKAPGNSSRRKFLNALFGGSLVAWIGTVIYPVAKFLVPPPVPDLSVNSVEAGVVSDFALNSSKIIRFGRKPVLVIRRKNGNFKALAATCTHLDCNVQFRSDLEQVWCACHNGFYDIEGRNISGPPPKPLPQYAVSISKDKVIISKEDLS